MSSSKEEFLKNHSRDSGVLKTKTVKTTFKVFVAQIEIKQLRLPWQNHFVQIISRVELN